MPLLPPPPPLRRCLSLAKFAAGATFAASAASAWYHAPVADDRDYDDDSGGDDATTGPRARGGATTTTTPSPPSSWLLDLARRSSIGVTTVAIRLFVTTYGGYEVADDDNYRKFLETVLRLGGGDDYDDNCDDDDDDDDGRGRPRRRRRRRGLITVSNHRSLFDDPGVVSCLLPLPIAIQPRYNRWALCSQEYCFNGALPGLIRGYIGAGQVLPIRRGGGIDQRPLLDFGRHLARGEWCHVFPEGGVWQWDELGGRRRLPPNAVVVSSSDFGRGDGSGPIDDGDDGAMRIIPATARQRALPPSPVGKLKWGVGKLIAHAPITPVVIPFAHRGMERLLPQDEDTGRTRFRDDFIASLLPRALGGNADDRLRVTVRFGEEISFDDLILEHESRHGKLWKYRGEVEDDEERRHDDGRRRNDRVHRESWKSSEAERVLYSKIVRRIEGRLDALTKEICAEERPKSN
ncbi:hypothetical protein ACHAW5_004278 [Stephanodiscus triporus]|uniref:Tafazzin family protein n=1 Tax=Stephanodiscus triporus TaxID=2934178 RepID=A0ABD3MLW0_9STRA